MTRLSTVHRISEPAAQSQPMTGVAGSMVDAFMHSSEAYTRAWLAWQEEVLRFLGSRLQWDGKVSAAFAKCRTVAELAEIQQDWALRTARDYFDEVGRLMQRAAHLVPSWMPSAARPPDVPRSHPVD